MDTSNHLTYKERGMYIKISLLPRTLVFITSIFSILFALWGITESITPSLTATSCFIDLGLGLIALQLMAGWLNRDEVWPAIVLGLGGGLIWGVLSLPIFVIVAVFVLGFLDLVWNHPAVAVGIVVIIGSFFRRPARKHEKTS